MKFDHSILPVTIVAMLTVGCYASRNEYTSEPDPANSSDTGTVTDFEGNEYSTVKIGDQWWMAENLKTSRSTDGTPLEGVYAYGDDESVVTEYGRLYEYDAAVGAAPVGWHLPSDDEWAVLEATLGDNAGIELREDGSSGFNARYGGYRSRLGDFESIGEWGSFWSSTLFISDHGHIRNITAGETTLNRWGSSIHSALSVRYVKD